MRGVSGIDVAKQLKEIIPDINIIFVTGYDEYTKDAMAMHASGYIEKPVTAGKVRKETEDLRYPLPAENEPRLKFRALAILKYMTELESRHISADRRRKR